MCKAFGESVKEGNIPDFCMSNFTVLCCDLPCELHEGKKVFPWQLHMKYTRLEGSLYINIYITETDRCLANMCPMNI